MNDEPSVNLSATRRRLEVRLARRPELLPVCITSSTRSTTPSPTCYGATQGSVGVAGALWRQTAPAAGLGEKTQVHGGGDGAEWITTQFGEQFGGAGQYLVDFWPVSEYLGAAAAVIAPQKGSGLAAPSTRAAAGKPGGHRVARPDPAPGTGDPGGSAGARGPPLLSGRRAQLDDAGARAASLPIGSGRDRKWAPACPPATAQTGRGLVERKQRRSDAGMARGPRQSTLELLLVSTPTRQQLTATSNHTLHHRV